MKGLNKRQDEIVEIVNERGYVSVNELGKRLEVSLVTIRKDLSMLEKEGYLHRTHGGAGKRSRFTFEKNVTEKEGIRAEAKTRIAKAALKLIKPMDFITLASGTTILYLARMLKGYEKLMVLTSSLGVSIELVDSAINVIQLGGDVRKSSRSVIGGVAEDILRDFSSNLLFLGVDGIDLDFGISTSNSAEAKLNQVMIEQADKVIVLADSTKINKRGFGRIAGLERVDTVITDEEIDSEFKGLLKERGIEIIVAKSED